MKFFPFFKRDPFPCTEKALARIIGKRGYNAVCDAAPDKRFIFQVAARFLETTERELVLEIGRKLHIPVAPRVVTTEFQSLPKGLRPSDLRENGYTAIYRDRMFHGIICTNPALISEHYKAFGEELQFLLAPWTDIARSLAESERRLKTLLSDQQQARRNELLRDLSKVLKYLVKEVEDHGASEVKISFDGDRVHYLFKTTAKKSGRGEISRSLITVMREFLDEASQNPCERIEREFFGEMYDQGRYYILRWQDPDGTMGEEEAGRALIPPSHNLSKQRTFEEKVRTTGAITEHRYIQFTTPVILIDDDPRYLSNVEGYFAREGLSTNRFTSAREALNKMKIGALRPRVMVCDANMPGINGLQVVRAIKEDPQFSDISIIIISDDDNPAVELSFIEAGCEAFMKKSEDPRILFARVEQLLRRKQGALEAA